MEARPTAEDTHAQSRDTGPLGGGLTLSLPSDRLSEFFLILQQGFCVSVRVGCSLMSLLCEELDLDREYVTDRVTTIFLNGKAIDDLENAIVNDGATVALSAAMPGLVGATMRRGGYYAAMRGAMTYHADEEGTETGSGEVRLKLFNLLLPELGPKFLRRGIILPPANLKAFLAERDEAFWEACGVIRLNGVAANRTDLLRKGCFPDDYPVTLTVHFGN